MERFLRVLGAACATILFLSCEKETAVPDSVSLDQVRLKLPEEIEVTGEGQTITCEFVAGYGPAAKDVVVLRSEDDIDTVIPIASLDKVSFTYALPSNFVLGRYNFCLRRDGMLKGFGRVSYVTEGGGGKIEPDASSTVYGLVSCGVTPLADVVVSDGYEVVRTDKNGVYQMKSGKECGYVFISVPSGYEVASNGVVPQLHKSLKYPASSAERVDFNLFEAGDQTNHTMLYFGDMHMANRTSDRKQFATFTSEISKYISEHPSDKVYAMTLGDMTWDLYWYQNNYCFAQYLADVNAIKGLQIFHAPGNHDHDMNATGDWDTILRFRKDICPNYYSFNIGKIHYIVIDDIQCTNKTASQTDGNVREYNDYVVNEVLAWLKKDLSFVSKDTPVVFTMHAPLYTKTGSSSLNNTAAFTAAFAGYDVTAVTGHTHVVYNVENGNIKEHNSGAVCAAWWWAGKYYPTFNMGTDGALGGYRITNVTGKTGKSLYKTIGRDENYQFRSYDRNRISSASFDVASSKQAAFKDEDKGNYSNSSTANEVLINVWDYNSNWKVEVSENGKNLAVTRLTNAYDPGFLLAYTVPRLKESSSVTWHSNATNHIFKATASSASSTLTIKVTDDQGRVYTEVMNRPKEFKIETYK